MTVAVYARISRPDQTVETQLAELRRYAGARGWTVHAEYVEHAVSGAKVKRPSLDRLLQDARKRRFDTIIVWKLDRFGRSLQHLVNTIAELSALGIRFVAVTQGIDTDASNPMAHLLLNILSSFAEFERELISERITASIAHQRSKGHPRYVPAETIQRAKSLREQGYSVRAIAKELNLRDGSAQRLAQSR